MDTETIFRLIFALLVIAALGIRLYGHLKAGTFHEPRRDYDEGWLTRIVRPLPILIGIASILYIAAPHLMVWSAVHLPLWLHVAAIPFGVVVISLMAWVHLTLSKNFSGKLQIRNDHTLVISGPYRWVRHPLYTAVIALFGCVFLLTANWFIGLGGLAMVLAVILTRTPKEEAMLVETFGDAYRDYRKNAVKPRPLGLGI
jgi:protein-S-isoprenylcysteine O-methyltransferase Ste14